MGFAKDVILARRLDGGGGGAAITDGIVITEMAVDGSSFPANTQMKIKKVDYYGTYMPFCTFGAARGDNAFAYEALTDITFKNADVYVSHANFKYCKSIVSLITSAIKGRDPRFEWRYNNNQQETMIFQYMQKLEVLRLPEFESFLGHYEIADCPALKDVYLPKVTKLSSYGNNNRGCFRNDTALETVQIGSIGYKECFENQNRLRQVGDGRSVADLIRRAESGAAAEGIEKCRSRGAV